MKMKPIVKFKKAVAKGPNTVWFRFVLKTLVRSHKSFLDYIVKQKDITDQCKVLSHGGLKTSFIHDQK